MPSQVTEDYKRTIIKRGKPMGTSLGSTQKGKAIESLIAATCIIGSEGQLAVSIPFVDDEGVDLIFMLKGGGTSISTQVKSCFKKGVCKTQIKKKNFKSRENFYIIFANYDTENAQLGEFIWFIPTIDFEKNLKNQSSEDHYSFDSKFTSNDMWKDFRIKLKELPEKILHVLRGSTFKK